MPSTSVSAIHDRAAGYTLGLQLYFEDNGPLAGSLFTLDNTTGGPSNAGVALGTSQMFHAPDRQIFFNAEELPQYARIKAVSMFEERRGNNTAAVTVRYDGIVGSNVSPAAHANGFSATRSTSTFATSVRVDPAIPLIILDPTQNHWDYAAGAGAAFISSIIPGVATASGGANDGVTTQLTGFNALVDFELTDFTIWAVTNGTATDTSNSANTLDVSGGIPAGWEQL